MTISFATKEDTQSVRLIWKECFGDTDSYMDAFFSFSYKPEQTLVAKENGICIGALQLFPHTFIINGKQYKSMYIGGVSVLPAYRMQGVAKRLMVEAERYMRNENVDLSFLVPFSFHFYEKLGYRCISYLSEFSGTISSLENFAKPYNASLCSASSLVNAYEEFASKFSVYLKRNEERFESEILPLCENHFAILLPDDAGYMIYEIRDRMFFAPEIAYRNKAALLSLLGFVFEKKDICDQFLIRTSADGTMRKILSENNIAERRFPHTMVKTFSDLKADASMQNYINMLGWF